MYGGVSVGYRIDYGQTFKRDTISACQTFKVKKKSVYIAATIIVVIIFMFCVGTKSIRSFLLPGDPIVTEHALNTFAEQIRVGEPFRDAATAFCQEIIAGADLS